MLRPQDILVSLKFLSPTPEAFTSYATLAASLSLSVSETHAAVKRAIRSGLLIPSHFRPENLAECRPSVPALGELLCYGIRYFFPAELGRVGMGIPTATSAQPLLRQLTPADVLHVSPHPRGSARGTTVDPLYSSAPEAAMRDPILAEWLALTDALRLHTGRIAELARNEIRNRLREFSYAAAA